VPSSSPFILSASRRTDIPAFYGEWFRNRLRAGWCETRNPFSGQVYRVSLLPRDVLGWVFWSRNYEPFLGALRELHDSGQRFICHFTITNFPRVLEPRVPPLDAAIATARRLAAAFGPDVVQWRYDPILLTQLTPPEWHEGNFAALAGRLEGSARRCIFSFPTMYRKTVRNLEALVVRSAGFSPSPPVRSAGFSPSPPVRSAGFSPSPPVRSAGFSPFPPVRSAGFSPSPPVRSAGFSPSPPVRSAGFSPSSQEGETVRVWSLGAGDFTLEDLSGLARRLAAIAASHGIRMETCCNDRWIAPEHNIVKAHCADWPLLRSLGAGRHLGDAGREARGGAETSDGAETCGASKPFGTPEPRGGAETRGTPDLFGEGEFEVPLHPTRRECGCYKSIDIGCYETCGHGCAYCYAVDDPARAQANLARHQAQAPGLG